MTTPGYIPSPSNTPSALLNRVYDASEARARYPELFDTLVPALRRGDPVGDDAALALRAFEPGARQALLDRALTHGVDAVPELPEPVRAMIEASDRQPGWVDMDRVERGGRAMMRMGVVGGLMLGVKSLVEGYCAPAGNKPLVFSGMLTRQVVRRLQLTSRFVQAVCAPGGMRPRAEGYAITAKVRLMHSGVRMGLVRSKRWRHQDWGLPINQHDMVATLLLFSTVLIDGVRKAGLTVPQEDADAIVHLWRYVGHVIGVEPGLMPDTEREALEVQAFFDLTQGPPDQDSITLVRALLDAPLETARDEEERQQITQRIGLSEAVCRFVIGDEKADALGLARNGWRFALPVIRAGFRGLDAVVRAVPGGMGWMERQGERYWEMVIAQAELEQH